MLKEKKLKIAFYTFSILELGGGLEKYFIETSSGLSKFKRIQADVITQDEKFTIRLRTLLQLFYLKKLEKLPINEPLKKIEDKLNRANYFKCALFKKLKKKLCEYDIIYSKNELLEAFVLKFLVGYRNIPPVIFGVHTPHYYPDTNTFQSRLHNLLYKSRIYNYLTSGVKAFHVINVESYKILKKQFSDKEVTLILHPFDANEFISKSKKNIYQTKKNNSKINILWAARLSYQKGVGNLVKIINEINRSKYKNKIIWNIAGNGSCKTEIMVLARRWSNVNYLGYVENNYMPSVMKKNDLFLSTSRWEGYPFNIIEAQTMDLPVISFNIAGPKDIIAQKRTGVLVRDTHKFIAAIKNYIDGKYNFRNISNYIRKKTDPNRIYKQLIYLFQKNTID